MNKVLARTIKVYAFNKASESYCIFFLLNINFLFKTVLLRYFDSKTGPLMPI